MRPNTGQNGAARARQNGLLGACVCALLPSPALATGIFDLPPLQSETTSVVLSALACGGVALALAAGLWALAEQRAANRLRRALKSVNARAKAVVSEREALLDAGREMLVIWGRDSAEPLSYGRGHDSLQACLKGPDASTLSAAIDELKQHGAGFQMAARDRHGRLLHVRGRAVGAMAAIWLEEPQSATLKTTLPEIRPQRHGDAQAATLESLQTAVAIFGPDQKLTFYNKAFATLWGLPQTFLDGNPGQGEILDRLRDLRKLPEQRDYQSWKRAQLAQLQNGRTHEEPWHLPGGQTIRVITQPHPFGGLTVLYDDVSARLALQSDYNTLMQVQSATLNTLGNGVAVFGPDGKLKLHNAAFAALWALEASALEGEPHVRTIAALSRDRFGDSVLWEHLISTIVASARAQDIGEIERSDRSILQVSTAPLPDGATLVTFSDVTERLRIENALRERNEGLEAADRLKSDFIKHVSYELRTPLNTILGFSEYLASGMPGALNSQQKEYVDAIVSGGNALKNLVNDILDLALVDAGSLRLDMERINLHTLIGDVATHAREWAAKLGLKLNVEIAPDAGDFQGDPRRLRQVLFNLLSNAFRFTPRGGTVTLAARIIGQDVQLCVADNGPGIPGEVKAKVFERFAAQSSSGNRAGAGLGLALVNRFLELHDGWVEIETRPGGGTLVRCHVPRRLGSNA